MGLKIIKREQNIWIAAEPKRVLPLFGTRYSQLTTLYPPLPTHKYPPTPLIILWSGSKSFTFELHLTNSPPYDILYSTWMFPYIGVLLKRIDGPCDILTEDMWIEIKNFHSSLPGLKTWNPGVPDSLLSQTRAALDSWLRFWSAGLNYRFGQIIDHYNWSNDWPNTKHCFNATNHWDKASRYSAWKEMFHHKDDQSVFFMHSCFPPIYRAQYPWIQMNDATHK